MRNLSLLLVNCGVLMTFAVASAQPPSGAGPEGLVERMMAFDKDEDGKLTKTEVTDDRLHRLFDRADADKDGVVTKAELTTLATREQARFRGGFGPPGGPGGPGGPMMAPPRPGDVLPAFFQRALNLTPEQKTQLDELQKDVDARLAKILTDEQKTTLDQMRRRGPGGFGPPGRGGPRPGPGRGGPGFPPPSPEGVR